MQSHGRTARLRLHPVQRSILQVSSCSCSTVALQGQVWRSILGYDTVLVACVERSGYRSTGSIPCLIHTFHRRGTSAAVIPAGSPPA